MKKIGITFCLLLIITVTAIGAVCASPATEDTHDYLRIHVRADSNDEDDQRVKYQVKQAVVDYLTPLIVDCTTKERAMEVVERHETDLTAVCDGVLQANGFAYRTTVALTREQFPTRVYGSVTLQEGVYDALIVKLGSGTGDNWWCVLYPPLCFSGGTQIVYRSWISDLITQLTT